MNKTFRYVHLSIVCIVCIFSITSFCGCASMNPMALETKSGALQLTSKSIGLFTLRTSNQYKPSYQPSVNSIEVIPQGNGKAVTFRVSKPHRHGKNQFFEYLISVDLPPGTYKVGYVAGQSNKIFVIGSFRFSVDASFNLSPDTVVYLGHVNMVNRKRKEGERRSGSVFPLIDQAASGYSGGTFDISVSDRSDTDILLFEQTYPQLGKYIIMKSIMKRQACTQGLAVEETDTERVGYKNIYAALTI